MKNSWFKYIFILFAIGIFIFAFAKIRGDEEAKRKEELNSYIHNYLINNNVDNKYKLLYMLKNIIKYMSSDKDSHTKIDFDKRSYLPLDYIFIEDTLFINSAFDEKFNKAKVLKINNNTKAFFITH